VASWYMGRTSPLSPHRKDRVEITLVSTFLERSDEYCVVKEQLWHFPIEQGTGYS
jgi:hypothetical protein